MIIKINSKYTNEDVILTFGLYSNGTTAIMGKSLNHEPLFTATVALDKKPFEGCVFLKGWSENEGVPESLVKAGVVELTGRTIDCGYCKAQEAKLLIDKE